MNILFLWPTLHTSYIADFPVDDLDFEKSSSSTHTNSSALESGLHPPPLFTFDDDEMTDLVIFILFT